MENKNNKKRLILSILGVFILIVAITGMTFAFFNYTRTGVANTIQVGRIYFTTSQNNTINLSNVFPVKSSNLATDEGNHDTVTINIEGDTTYTNGIEYKVTLEDVHNTLNNKEVPISFAVNVTNLGDHETDYYTERGGEDAIYNYAESGSVEDGTEILVGYIPSGATGVDGSIDITAYIDGDRVAISDTVSTIENGNLVYGETRGDWIAGREVFTTTEWNSLTGNNAVSFKVKVEANEGIWVEEEQFYVMKNLHLAGNTSWASIRANITSIEFHEDGIAPENPVDTINATDVTSKGTVTLYTVDDGLGTNTKKAIVVAAGEIYAPENSMGLFALMSKLTNINSQNFRVDNVNNMTNMFSMCSSLTNLNFLINWNTNNVESFRFMFYYCRSLADISGLINWDTSNVTNMENVFCQCTNITSVNGLINWDTSNVENMYAMFKGCTNLTNTDGLINWNTSNVTNMYAMFGDCTNLSNINGLINWNTSNVESMYAMFNSCTSLTTLALSRWNTSSVTNMGYMFQNCTNLTSVDLSSWDMSKVTNNYAMFENVSGTPTLSMPKNYTRIDNFMFNHNSNYNGDSFTIPRTVTIVGNSHIFYDFGKDNTFNKFIVESGSTSLKTIDDVLYTYDGTRLISVPRGKTFINNTYEMPEGITSLNTMSFSRTQKIDKVVLPNSYVISRWYDDTASGDSDPVKGNSLSTAIYVYTSVKEYDVKSDNPNYSSDSGCIYSKDGTELIAVPVHYNGVLNIKAGTTTIGQEAFWKQRVSNIDSITAINIPASVTTIEANQLTTLNSLMSRSTNPVTITIDSGNTAYQISGNKIVAR